ncbi:uncharacterized protein MELLADRAFT_109866 [Melampsora larici-populina 98AG31]|uniref:Uncharacterized protein n=1 Tax=Melampsora larici-populina (strain 98AG31 / pathotype 3-4-7) TaxID=747676 RepID=F4RXW3_MELLP|nr:uncharacterized protein MELLADRAFT_109866 [Melampsora larici-populina 98AG31]EGG02799.1 hypothetical protein MELLADRAFT_109866 [Melampsora larici-populina 98AG31]
MRGIFQLRTCQQALRITFSTNPSHRYIKPRFLSTASNQPITNQLTSDFKLIHLLKDIKTCINSFQTEPHDQEEKEIISSLNSSIQDLKQFKENRLKRLGVYGDRISGRDQFINCLLCDPLNESYHQTTDQLLNSRNIHQTGLIRIRYGSIAKWNEDQSILEIPNQWLKENNIEIIEDEKFKSLEENDIHLLIIDNIRKEIQPQMYFKLLHFNEFFIGINQIGYQKDPEEMSFNLPQSLIPLKFPKPFEINTFQTLNSFKTFQNHSGEGFDLNEFYKLREEIKSISLNPHQVLQTSISRGRLSISSISQTILKSSETLIELENLIKSHEEKIKSIRNELNQTMIKVDEKLIQINENQIQEFFNEKLKWWKVLIFSIDIGEPIRNFTYQEDIKLKLLLSYQSGQLSIYSKTLKTLTKEILQTQSPLIPSTTKHNLLICLNQNESQLQLQLQNLYDLQQKDLNLERFVNVIKQEYSTIYLKYSTISVGFLSILGFSWYGQWIGIENVMSFLGVFGVIGWLRLEGIWKKRVLRKGLKDWKRSKELLFSQLKEKETNLIEKEIFKTNENVVHKFQEILKVHQTQIFLQQVNVKELIQRLDQLEIEIRNQNPNS